MREDNEDDCGPVEGVDQQAPVSCAERLTRFEREQALHSGIGRTVPEEECACDDEELHRGGVR